MLLTFTPRAMECKVRGTEALLRTPYSVHGNSDDLLSKYQTGKRIPHHENGNLHYPYPYSVAFYIVQQPRAFSWTPGKWSRLDQFAVSLLQRGRHYPLKLHDPSSLPLSLCCWTIATRITVVDFFFFFCYLLYVTQKRTRILKHHDAGN